MRQTLRYDEAREQRLELYYQRQLTSLIRKEAADSTVNAALNLTRDAGLPRFSVEFRLDDEIKYVPGRWAQVSGLGAAFELYVARLCEMEKVRFGHSAIDGLTPAHHEAFDAVVESAEALASLGWPVNWQQNIQTILEPAEYGLRDGKLVDRFADLPESVSLGEELRLLGTLTFYQQNRSADGKITSFKSKVLTATNRALHEATQLRLLSGSDNLPSTLRYCSDWMLGKSGAAYRIAV